MAKIAGSPAITVETKVSISRSSTLQSADTAGVVLYDGEIATTFGENLFAVPIRTLWEPAA